MTELSTPSPNPAHDTGELPGLTLEERQLLAKMFSDPMSIPPEWKAWLVSYLEANPPVLPISQIHGFSGFTFKAADTIATSQNRANTAYGDLATVGPELTELADGQYAIFFGAQIAYPVSDSAYMSIDVNGAGASDSDAVRCGEANPSVLMHQSRVVLKTLDADGSNTITAKYKTRLGGSGNFQQRWLIAVKYANL